MPQKILYKKIINFPPFYFFLLLAITNFVLIGAAVQYYAGNFPVIQYPFSVSGEVYGPDGLNILSSRLYALDQWISGGIMMILAVRFYLGSEKNHSNFLSLLSFLTATGFILAGFSPNDTSHGFHVVGSSFIVASLWIITSSYIFSLAPKIAKWKYFALHIILQGTIFSYATTYFIDLEPLSSILQKFALLGMGITLLYSTRVSMLQESINRTS